MRKNEDKSRRGGGGGEGVAKKQTKIKKIEIFKIKPKIVVMLPQSTPELFLFSHWLLN